MMLPSPVEYVTYWGGELHVPDGKAYVYYLAGNGVFKYAVTRHFTALIPLAACRVAGLADLRPHVRVWSGRIPETLLFSLLADARRRSRADPREAMYHLLLDNGRVRAIFPPQDATAASLSYTGGDSPDIVCELHSHQEMGAFFSKTDDRDEQGSRFYAVMGRIFSKPQMLLRVGVYGDFWNVPVTVLFTGPGPFGWDDDY